MKDRECLCFNSWLINFSLLMPQFNVHSSLYLPSEFLFKQNCVNFNKQIHILLNSCSYLGTNSAHFALFDSKFGIWLVISGKMFDKISKRGLTIKSINPC